MVRAAGLAMGDGCNRVVMGDCLYRVDTPWGDLTGGPELGFISQVAVDSEGSLFILQRSFPPLIVLDLDGQFEPLAKLSGTVRSSREFDMRAAVGRT